MPAVSRPGSAPGPPLVSPMVPLDDHPSTAEQLKLVEEMLMMVPADVSTARRMLTTLHNRDPENSSVLAALGAFKLVHEGDAEAAATHLEQADRIAPDGRTLLYLGQIAETRTAVLLEELDSPECSDASRTCSEASRISQMAESYFRRGIELLSGKGAAQTDETKRQIVDFYLALADHFMTPPACDRPDAPTEAAAAVDSAVKILPGCVDALITRTALARVTDLCAGDEDLTTASRYALDAVEALERVTSSDDEGCMSDELPSIESRIKLCQLLIELQMHQKATEILERLSLEDEKNAEVWFLLALVLLQGGDLRGAASTINAAQQLMSPEESLADAVEVVRKRIINAMEATGIDPQVDEDEEDSCQEGSDAMSE